MPVSVQLLWLLVVLAKLFSNLCQVIPLVKLLAVLGVRCCVTAGGKSALRGGC